MAGFPSKRQRFDPDDQHQNVLPLLTMVSGLSRVKGEPHDEWLSREEIRALRRVLQLQNITAARAHQLPRRRLLPHPRQRRTS
eukprot:14675532-Heterocapsa_arctica.AAC.1